MPSSRVAVSPARAGMDPRFRPTAPRPNRFPRTRGDGPVGDQGIVRLKPFPPHARGWTVRPTKARVPVKVSPARAGMDPRFPTWKATSTRFPRTRGDGPWATTLLDRHCRFPPHARGWTLRLDPDRRAGRVSPARAGMDPSPRGWREMRSRFPRTRGDGPDPLLIIRDKTEFPPHARGWTPIVAPPVSSRTSHRFPRTRGDGPHPAATGTGTTAFPPHARGWTRHRRGHGHRDRVSPARAGMDPLLLWRIAEHLGFPRTRGDGPFGREIGVARSVFPPHARGWTLLPQPGKHAKVVSPARAGMDPGLMCPVSRPGRFPRTRGDGPLSRCGAAK